MKIALVSLLVFIAACTNYSQLVEIDPAHNYCTIDSDCVYIEVSCNNCNCGSPVNREVAQQYLVKTEGKCDSYRGEVCDQLCNEKFMCMDNRCVAYDPQLVTEERLVGCQSDEDCAIVPYYHCCGQTKRAINKFYEEAYNARPEWQEVNNEEICYVVGVCMDDSNVNETKCEEGTCTLVYP